MRYHSYILHSLRSVWLAAALLSVSAPLVGIAQQARPPIPGAQPPPPAPPPDVWEEQQHKEMEKKANVQRQQDIKKDTEKLLELATELKQAVEKSSENTLSLDVIKKAEQIEKLAKQVKEKMKGP